MLKMDLHLASFLQFQAMGVNQLNYSTGLSARDLVTMLMMSCVDADFLNFLDAYFAPRQGQVLAQGLHSDCFEIANSLFQDTVLGPPLQNIFFADVSTSASSTGGREAMFADDLNVFQEFDRLLPTVRLS